MCFQLSNTGNDLLVLNPANSVTNVFAQVDECMANEPVPQEHTWMSGTSSVIPRWPNHTDWMSAQDLEKVTNKTHTVPYFIPDGWGTNLVTTFWALNQSNNAGQDLYEGEYMYQGAKRVHYHSLTIEDKNFTIEGVPDGRFDPSLAYFNTERNEMHYWSAMPTNETTTYHTRFRVWGKFVTYVTHLSNDISMIECHTQGNCSDTVEANTEGRQLDTNIMQCPFQFRCFSPESVSNSPNCHRNFPADFMNSFNSSSVVGESNGVSAKGVKVISYSPTAPNIRPCVESCPGCETCPMLECWKDENNIASGAWNATTYKNTTALQHDYIPYM